MAIELADLCLHTQEELERVAGENGNPMNNRQPAGMIEALMSDANRDGIEVSDLLDKGDGKLNTVSLKYMKPDAISDSSDTITDLCDEAGVAHTYVYTEPELTREVQSETKLLTEDQFRTLCDPSAEAFRTKLIMGAMNSVILRMDRAMITDYVAGAGGFIDGDAGPNSYAFLNNDSGINAVDPNGFISMMIDYENTGAVGRPIIVADGNFHRYAKLEDLGCCNQLGQNIAGSMEGSYYYDRQIDSTLTDASENNLFMVWAPGAAQMLNKNYNRGDFRKVGSDFLFDTITDPRTGITFDFELYYDKCNPRGYRFNIKTRYGLFQLPLDMFKAGDQRFGINFNFLFAATVS